MSNPSIVYCPPNTWKRVATDVLSGQVGKLSSKPVTYLQTYRKTGEASPTSRLEGVEIFLNDNFEIIDSDEGIDVYIMAIGLSGKVRVDV